MSTKSNSFSQTGLSRDQVLADVKRIVGEQMDISPEKIRETDELINDLGCDSLDVIEIAMEAEKEFGITVPDEVTDATRTVADIVDGVLQLLGGLSAD